jgi:hypothetical protein
MKVSNDNNFGDLINQNINQVLKYKRKKIKLKSLKN